MRAKSSLIVVLARYPGLNAYEYAARGTRVQEEPLRRRENSANSAARTIPVASSQNELGSGVETGGVGAGLFGGGGTGVWGTKGGTPGPRIGGSTGEPGEFEMPPGPFAASGPAGMRPSAPVGKNSLPSPGSNCASRGGTNVGSLNSSGVGSLAATGFAAIGERRFAQRTRARFSPSEMSVSPAGISMRFFVQ